MTVFSIIMYYRDEGKMKKVQMYLGGGLLIMMANAAASSGHANDDGWILLAVAIIISGAALSWIVKRFGFPAVMGELGLGMFLAVLGHYHIWHWEQAVNHQIIAWLAELGSILLLYEIGLESRLKDLLSVGKHGAIAAIIGVVAPFILGLLVGQIFFPEQSYQLNLFLGATLAATSTGISVRVFKDLGILRNPACQIVLTASIIDDILGLIILSMVSGLVIAGSMSIITIGHILVSVVIFFFLAFVVAQRVTPKLIRWFLKISNEEAMVMALLIAFGLLWAWFANAVGLAAIIGSFVAGLILDEVFFSDSRKPKWFQDLEKFVSPEHSLAYHELVDNKVAEEQSHYLISLVKPLNYILVPFFFVFAGMQVDLVAVASLDTLMLGGALSLAAVLGKVICGVFLPKGINRWIVGFGMLPRGEIGLIFALTGRQLGVFNQQVFAGILIMVVVTSVITPLLLQLVAKGGINEN